MKKTVSFLLAALLALSLAGCGGSQAPVQAASKGSGSTSQTVSDVLANAGQDLGTEEKAGTEGDWSTISDAEREELLAEGAAQGSSTEGVDVDLTAMSSTMVYAEVSNIMYEPDDYVGKIIRMKGQAASAYAESTDTAYYAIIIADATACCAQGIEYLLAEGEYPADQTEAIVTGEFELYDEDGQTYCRLKNAVIEL